MFLLVYLAMTNLYECAKAAKGVFFLEYIRPIITLFKQGFVPYRNMYVEGHVEVYVEVYVETCV